MVGSRVTKRYAKALFELAKENDLLAGVDKNLAYLRQIAEKSDQFQEILISPVIQMSKKKEVFEKLFRAELSELTINFLNLLLLKNREPLLLDIIDQFDKLKDAAEGIVRGHLFSASEFDDKQKKLLVEQLEKMTGKQVVLQEDLDKTLLGGFVVRLDDTVIDSSLKTQLTRLREKMISGE